MGHEEEIEFTVLHLGLLDKAVVDVRALRWVLNEFVALLRLALLEESLTNALVNDDQGDLGRREGLDIDFLGFLFFGLFLRFLLLEQPVLLSDDLV